MPCVVLSCTPQIAAQTHHQQRGHRYQRCTAVRTCFHTTSDCGSGTGVHELSTIKPPICIYIYIHRYAYNIDIDIHVYREREREVCVYIMVCRTPNYATCSSSLLLLFFDRHRGLLLLLVELVVRVFFRLGCGRTDMRPIPLLTFLDSRGFDSSIILISRGGLPRPTGDFPESLSQAMLVG